MHAHTRMPASLSPSEGGRALTHGRPANLLRLPQPGESHPMLYLPCDLRVRRVSSSTVWVTIEDGRPNPVYTPLSLAEFWRIVA